MDRSQQGGRGRPHAHDRAHDVVDRGAGFDQPDDALALDGDITWCEVLCDGEFERRAIGHLVDDLDATFTKRCIAEDDATVVVLDGAADDLGGRGAAWIDEDDDGVGGLGASAHGEFFLAHFVALTDGADDGAIFDKEVTDFDGLVKESARVTAKVEDKTLHATHLLLEILEVLFCIGEGVGLEVLDAQVTDLVIKRLACDAFDLDDRAFNSELAWFIPAFTKDPEIDLGARLAAKQSDSFIDVHVDGGFFTDAHDGVARLDTFACGGSVGDGAHDGELTIACGDDDTEATKLSASLGLHLLVVLRRQQVGVRIECAEHTVDRGVFDVLVFDVRVFTEGFFNEGEDFFEFEAHLPEALDGADLKGLALGLDGDRNLFGGRIAILEGALVVDDDFSDGVLDFIQRGEEHFGWIKSFGFNVAVFETKQDAAQDKQRAQVVILVIADVCGPFGAAKVELNPSIIEVYADQKCRDQADEGDHKSSCLFKLHERFAFI